MKTLIIEHRYAFLIPYFLLHFCFIINQLNVSFTSLERLLFYSSDFIPQEDSWRKPECDPPTFPTKGTIRFVDASLRYRPDLPEALRHVDLSIEAGERVAVVGRTGAGKSSLLTLLFRLNEPSTGYVEIDGYDVKTLGLLTLRESISVVPQEPLLIWFKIYYLYQVNTTYIIFLSLSALTSLYYLKIKQSLVQVGLVPSLSLMLSPQSLVALMLSPKSFVPLMLLSPQSLAPLMLSL